MKKTVWEKIDDGQREKLFAFCEDYRRFLSASKTERAFVKNAAALAEAAGFMPLHEKKTLAPGDRVYVTNRNKNIFLFVIGSRPLTEGLNILGAHIDSPRTDLKQVPLYESEGIALLDTHYYGGIKKYQWVARPLSLCGVIVKKDGTVIDVNLGEKEGDPVFGISDLLIHLASKQMVKKANEVIEGEKLDITFASIPLADTEKDAVKANVLEMLKKEYGVEEDDFLSAEIEAVPAGEARDYGIDRSMIIGYGHDDRACAYTSLRALLDMEAAEKTACVMLVDKEEIGSVGATSMQSRFFEMVLSEMLEKQGYSGIVSLNRTFAASKVLSNDVAIAFDPNYPEVMEKKNSAYFGKGVAFLKFTGARGKSGSNDACAEYMARIRQIMDDADITFQTAELGAVDAGGGGTIAYVLGNLNMDVIDAGIPVQNMHAPCEVVSKADVYEAYRAYRTFLEKMN